MCPRVCACVCVREYAYIRARAHAHELLGKNVKCDRRYICSAGAGGIRSTRALSPDAAQAPAGTYACCPCGARERGARVIESVPRQPPSVAACSGTWPGRPPPSPRGGWCPRWWWWSCTVWSWSRRWSQGMRAPQIGRPAWPPSGGYPQHAASAAASPRHARIDGPRTCGSQCVLSTRVRMLEFTMELWVDLLEWSEQGLARNQPSAKRVQDFLGRSHCR